MISLSRKDGIKLRSILNLSDDDFQYIKISDYHDGLVLLTLNKSAGKSEALIEKFGHLRSCIIDLESGRRIPSKIGFCENIVVDSPININQETIGFQGIDKAKLSHVGVVLPKSDYQVLFCPESIYIRLFRYNGRIYLSTANKLLGENTFYMNKIKLIDIFKFHFPGDYRTELKYDHGAVYHMFLSDNRIRVSSLYYSSKLNRDVSISFDHLNDLLFPQDYLQSVPTLKPSVLIKNKDLYVRGESKDLINLDDSITPYHEVPEGEYVYILDRYTHCGYKIESKNFALRNMITNSCQNVKTRYLDLIHTIVNTTEYADIIKEYKLDHLNRDTEYHQIAKMLMTKSLAEHLRYKMADYADVIKHHVERLEKDIINCDSSDAKEIREHKKKFKDHIWRSYFAEE